jgi:hypothetical protein
MRGEVVTAYLLKPLSLNMYVAFASCGVKLESREKEQLEKIINDAIRHS